MDMLSIADTLTQGILLGGLYALFATGLALVFGVMRLVNLAHGDLIILAAYLCLAAANAGRLPILRDTGAQQIGISAKLIAERRIGAHAHTAAVQGHHADRAALLPRVLQVPDTHAAARQHQEQG